MPDDTHLTEPWEGDVNEAVIEEWKEDTTAFDRITTVIDATTEPAFAREIADRAAVAEPTARRHLKSLAEVGRVAAVSADGGTKYKRSPTTLTYAESRASTPRTRRRSCRTRSRTFARNWRRSGTSTA
jgi:DNA-binding IclR family transcriptional regulator